MINNILCKGLKKSVLSFFLLLVCMPSNSFAVHQTCLDWMNTLDASTYSSMIPQYSSYSTSGGWSPSYCPVGGLPAGGSSYEHTSFDTITKYERWPTNGNCFTTRYSFNNVCTVPPTEPLTCADGVVSGAETGIDCGDASCIDGDDVCTVYCPLGFAEEVRQGLTGCYSEDLTADYTVDAKLGVCPSNLFVSNTDSSKCVTWALPTWASSDYLETVETDPADSTPWNNVFTDENTTFNTATYNTAGVITDVSTATTTGTTSTGAEVANTETTTTVTEVDGSKVETTVTDSTNRSTGGVLTGTTTTTVRTYDPGGTLTGETSSVEQVGNTEDAGASFVAPGEGEAYVLDEEKAGQFATRYTSFASAVTDAPVFAPIAALFDAPDTSSKTPVFTMSMGSYGSQSLDLTNYDSAFSVLGKIFVFLSLLAAGRLVFINRGS